MRYGAPCFEVKSRLFRLMCGALALNVSILESVQLSCTIYDTDSNVAPVAIPTPLRLLTMEKLLKIQIQKTLEGLGLHAARKVGRPPRGLAPGEEIWTVTAGPTTTAHQLLVTPYRDGAPIARKGEGIDLPRLWVAEHLPHVTAERLIAAGAAFADGAGNAHVQLPGIVVHVLGNNPLRRAKEPRARPRREWRGPAIRAVFELLCDPALAQRPLREQAAVVGTAPGTIAFLLQDLERTGNLVRLGGHARRFIPDRSLIEYWIGEYERKLHPKLTLGRFKAATNRWWAELEVARLNAVWGGEMAASLLEADLRPANRTLYTTKDRLPQLLKHARLRADPEGDVELRQRFWRTQEDTPRADTAPPLLVAADLRIVGDARCRAAARYVLERYVAGFINDNDA